MNKYAKAVVATLVAVGAALMTALGTSPQQNLAHLDTKTWLVAIGAILASGGMTWWTENVPGVAGGIIKGGVASAGAFVTVLVTAYADNFVSQAELIGAISSAIVALGAVYQISNKPTT